MATQTNPLFVPRARLPAPEATVRPLAIRITLLAILSGLVGAGYTVKVAVVGEAALAELLLPVVAVVAMLSSSRTPGVDTRALRWLLFALVVTLLGYVVSDLTQGSSEAQYLRGWGRVALVMTDFVSLALVARAQPQAIWWFVAGMGLGRIAWLRLSAATPISMWKFSFDGFGYGEPMTLAAMAVGAFLPLRAAAALQAALAAISMAYDFRIQAGVCLLLALVLWMRAGSVRGGARGLLPMLRLGALGSLAAIAIYAALTATQDDYSLQRRATSDIGRSLGKAFAVKAIAESPLIGYGSWSRSPDFARLQEEALRDVAGSEASRFPVGDSSSAVHSMILQAWVEGGILAIAFFVALAVFLLARLPGLIVAWPLDPLSPMLLYFGVYGLWHTVMSAFAAPLRLHLALAGIAVLLLGTQRGRAAPAHPPDGAGPRRPLQQTCY
jgi:O-antigen ligase